MAENPDISRGPEFPPRIIASLLELSERRLQQLVAEGWITKPQRGMYSLRESVRGYIRYLKEHTKESARGNEQGRLARAQAVKVELQNLQSTGDLVPREMVAETLTTVAAQLASLLDGMPGRVATQLVGLEAAEIRKGLLVETRRIRLALSESLDSRADALEALPAGSADPETTEGPDA